MSDRATLACQAAEHLRQWRASGEVVPALIGFDGFVDSIIDVVDKRHDADRYDAVSTIEAFGRKVLAAAGHSSNFEMVTKRQKLGGNGPIMANALARAGIDVTYIGCLGRPELHPVFEPLAEMAKVHSIAEPGFTDALEFEDGKLLMGKYESLKTITRDRVVDALGMEALAAIIARSRLLGMVNWTMLPFVQTVWDMLAEEVLPEAGPTVGEHRRLIFVDLADPEKRTSEDLASALKSCQRMDRQVDVLLGLNTKEAAQVGRLLGLPEPVDVVSEIEATARGIRETLDLHGVVVHPRQGAAAAMREPDGQVRSARFDGPFVRQPQLSTGAGDNFNAGFCLGRLAGLPVEPALLVGTATSGYYVRHAESPTLDELAAFCDELPDPEC